MREIVALIGRERGRSSLRSADTVAYRRHAIDHRREELAVVAVGRAEPAGEGNTLAVRNEVPLTPCLAPVRRVRAGALAPLWPVCRRCREQRGSSRWQGRAPDGRAERDATRSRRRRLASRAAAASMSSAGHLLRQHLPGQAAPQHEQDAGQRRPVWEQRPTAFRLWPLRWEQRLDQGPSFVGNERLGQAAQNSPLKPPCPVLLGVLIPDASSKLSVSGHT